MKLSLKNLFFEEEPTTTEQEQKTEPTSIQIATPSSSVAKPEADSKIKKMLLDTLEDECGQDLGYFKFKQSLDQMKAIIPDEKTCFLSSYIPIKTLGFSKEKLLTSANRTLNVLDFELKKFEEVMEEQRKTKIGSTEKTIEAITNNITLKTEQLKKLTEEISELQKQKIENENLVKGYQDQIKNASENFVATHNALAQDIKTDITKITSYLEA